MDIKALLTEAGVQEEAIGKAEKAIKKAIGDEFVDKERYKTKLEEISTLTDKLATAEDAVTTADTWKAKYETLHGEFDTFKQDTANKETLSTKRALAKKALLDSGVKEDILEDFMLSALDYEAIEVNDGQMGNVEKFVAAQKERYGKYFGEIKTEGAQVANPPANDGGTNYVAKLEAARKAGDTAAAVRIKTEAAKENIILI